MLELASGSGEHAVAFQSRFPGICWQASDLEPEHRRSIDAWIAASNLDGRMPSALDIDVQKQPWDLPEPVVTDLAAVVCINLLHISPADCTRSLLKQAERLLPQAAPLIIYGPFDLNACINMPANNLTIVLSRN